jgi:S-DNA-T family DNA segregation ATPase FtsK/SpoIIIE
VVESRKASTSLLQRKLRVGYARAARIMEEMEEQGIIGPADGARPREVLISSVAELDSGNSLSDEI